MICVVVGDYWYADDCVYCGDEADAEVAMCVAGAYGA